MLLYKKLGLRPDELFTIPGNDKVMAYFDEKGKLYIPNENNPRKSFDLYQELILNSEVIAKRQCYKFMFDLINLLRLSSESFTFDYSYGYITIRFSDGYELNLSRELEESYPFKDVFAQEENFKVSDIVDYLKPW